MSKLKPNPVSMAAIQMAIAKPDPGIVFIEEGVPVELDGLIPNQLTGHTTAIRFVPAQEISNPQLLNAIAECNFADERIIAQGGKALLVAVAELHNALTRGGVS
jgi:hypothetical protein